MAQSTKLRRVNVGNIGGCVYPKSCQQLKGKGITTICSGMLVGLVQPLATNPA